MNWTEDLQFVFEGGIAERLEVTDVFFGAPFLKITGRDDVTLFLERIGCAGLREKHLADLAKTAPPEIDEEIRMRQEFASDVAGVNKTYKVLGFVWYSQVANFPVDVALLAAIIPPLPAPPEVVDPNQDFSGDPVVNVEELVEAKLQEISAFLTNEASKDECARVITPER